MENNTHSLLFYRHSGGNFDVFWDALNKNARKAITLGIFLNLDKTSHKGQA